MKPRYRGVYRYRVKAWMFRRTKYWTASQIEHAKQQAKLLRELIGWE